MKYKLQLKSISDDELLRRLSALLQKSRRVESELIAHIGEVDARKLYARQTSSMFSYCTEILNLSEHEAYLRIAVARASRKQPILLEMLADGRLHLSGIAKLAPHLTEANRETLLERATHKTKSQIEEMVAEITPKPDVPTKIRKLPELRKKTGPTPPQLLGPDQVAPSVVPSTVRPAVVQPLAPKRYRVELTASEELHDKLKRLQALMRSSVPDGDLATIIEEAVTEKLEKLEAKRFGKTKVPRKSLGETDTSPSSRHIPAAVKRAVHERDRGQCAYIDPNGRRCTERAGLEFHHSKPFGLGGDHSVGNIQLACRTHNGYLAAGDYGREVMERFRKHGRSPSRVSEPPPTYHLGSREPTKSSCNPICRIGMRPRVTKYSLWQPPACRGRRGGEPLVSSSR